MNKKYTITALVIIVLVGTIFIFLPKNTEKETDKIKVTASFYPLYFFAQQIGQDKIDIVNITPSGAEPHDYEPTAKDLAAIEDSSLLLINGAGLEPWATDMKKNLQNTVILPVGESLANQQITEDGQNVKDPHIWLSPPLAKEMADKIMQGLVFVDPANKDFYQLSATALKLKLDILDEKFKNGLASCQQRNIVTSHTAFGYLAGAYNLNQVPILGLSPDAEPSGQQLADITKFVKDNKVTYIFFESLVNPKLSNTIATETGAKTLELNPIEGLDNEQLSEGQDYFTKMEKNLTNLKTALQCR